MTIQEFARFVTACHECGHAAMAELLKFPYAGVTIRQVGCWGGRVIDVPMIVPHARLANFAEVSGMVALASWAAIESGIRPIPRDHPSFAGDIDSALRICRRCLTVPESEEAQYLDCLAAKTLALMRTPLMVCALNEIGRELLSRETLAAARVHQLYEKALSKYPEPEVKFDYADRGTEKIRNLHVDVGEPGGTPWAATSA